MNLSSLLRPFWFGTSKPKIEPMTTMATIIIKYEDGTTFEAKESISYTRPFVKGEKAYSFGLEFEVTHEATNASVDKVSYICNW